MLLKNWETSVCLFWLLTMQFIADATAADWHQANYIVDSFFEIALKNEYLEKGQSVRKWPANGIRYHYVHRVMDNSLHEQLPGHKITSTTNRKFVTLYSNILLL